MFERLEDCAVREAREEAGIDVVLDRLLCVTDHTSQRSGSTGCHRRTSRGSPAVRS
jgi:8-oxo-dGTP pyrophosphatase MutT (NUDIX family)